MTQAAAVGLCPECGRGTSRPIKTTCRPCYQRKRRERMPSARCHPERREHAGGLCRSCYRAGGRVARATCHPDRLQAAKGLCTECYRNLPAVKAAAIRARRLKKYKLDAGAFDRLAQAQAMKCAVCDDQPTAVDHCHSSGRVRGLLCHRCNAGLGMFRDSPDLLGRAADYLRRTAT